MNGLLKKHNKKCVMMLLSLVTLIPFAVIATPLHAPELLLAKVYKEQIILSDYWVSEKYDGVRAYWDGKFLISRQGNRYIAPSWFTQGFPNYPLDGELWIARNRFEALLSTVRKETPIDQEWKQVTYQLFELPNAKGNFTQRLSQLKNLLKTTSNPYLKLIPQYRLQTHQQLMKNLDATVKIGGEGLMLHYAGAAYHTGRSPYLLKVKRHQDAEATVIQHLQGKGKYRGKLGALLVEMPDGVQFRIGTGFSDQERQYPPVIGAVITYKFFGKTRKGIPRFASFLRVRSAPKVEIMI